MPVAGKNSSRQNESNAKILDIVLKRGDTLNFTFELNYIDSAGDEQPYDFTGATVKAHIKKKKTDPNWFRVITLSTSSNVITFYMTDEATKIPAGRYYYDIEVQDSDGYHETVLEGVFTVTQDVTEWIDSLEEEYTSVFQTSIELATLPFFNPASYVFGTQFSYELTAFIKKIFTATFLTTFGTAILPHFTNLGTFNTGWSVQQLQSQINYSVFGTSWSADIQAY